MSKEAGTTRDIVEVGIDIGGFFCRLGDTAGLRKSTPTDAASLVKSIVGEIEQEGIKRAKARAFDSNVVILVLSVEPIMEEQGALLYIDEVVMETARELLQQDKIVIAVVNKMDNYSTEAEKMALHLRETIQSLLPQLADDKIFCISCLRASAAQSAGVGDTANVQQLLNGLVRTFQSLTSPVTPEDVDNDPSIWQESLGATERQRTLLDTCHGHLQEFLGQVHQSTEAERTDQEPATTPPEEENNDIDIVVAAESLRAAAECLAKLTGRGDTGAGDVEEVLGVVFEKYACSAME